MIILSILLYVPTLISIFLINRQIYWPLSLKYSGYATDILY